MDARLASPQFVRLWLATLGAFSTFGMLVLTLPLYVKDELDGGAVAVGFAMGVASITAVVASPLSGRLADRRGRRPLVVAGGLVMLACYLALSLGPSLALVIPIRLIAGAAEAAFVVPLYTMVTDLAPEGRHGEAMSLVTLASYIGLTMGPVIADLMLGGGRFALVWVLAAAITLASLVALAPVPETRPEGAEPAHGWLLPRGAIMPGLLVLVGLVGFGGFAAFSALYARELGIGRPGLVLALFGGVVALVRLFGRRLPDRLGAERTLTYSFVALASGLAVIGAWQSPVGLLVGTAVFALGQALTFPSAVLLAMSATSPAERSAAVGSVGAFVDVALGLGALSLGGVAAVTGYGGAFLVASVVAISGLFVLAPLRRSRRVALEEAAR